MEDLVLSIEQGKHLQELGLDMSDAKMCWFRYIQPTFLKNEKWTLTFDFSNNKEIEIIECIPTYTLQEILDRLPIVVYSRNGEKYELFIDYSHRTVSYYNWVTHECYVDIQADSKEILDSAYETLCLVIKEGHKRTK